MGCVPILNGSSTRRIRSTESAKTSSPLKLRDASYRPRDLTLSPRFARLTFASQLRPLRPGCRDSATSARRKRASRSGEKLFSKIGSSLRPMGWQGGGEGGWRRKRACVPSLPTRRCAARSADDATCVTREAGLQSIHVRQRGAQNFHLHRRALAAEARPRRLGGRMFHQVWSGRGCPGNARNGAPTRRRRAPGSPSHRSATSPLGRSARQR